MYKYISYNNCFPIQYFVQGGRAQHDFSLAGWKQPDIPVEVDRLETVRNDAGVLKKLSLAGIAKLSRLKYS